MLGEAFCSTTSACEKKKTVSQVNVPAEQVGLGFSLVKECSFSWGLNEGEACAR